MSHLPFILPEHLSITRPPPPALQVSNPTDATGEEEKTTSEPEPPRAQPAQGEEETLLSGHHPEYPTMSPHPSGEGPYPPMQDGVYPQLEPGNPATSTQTPPIGYPKHAQPPRYLGVPHGAAINEASLRNMEESSDLEDCDYKDSGKKVPADTSSTSRARIHVKSKIPAQQEFVDRRARKNANARVRAATRRAHIEIIEKKPDNERTEEERELLDSYQYSRQRKNDRSRERAIERKTETERILAKPEKSRTKIERDYLETTMYTKQRKNHIDRMRRQRIKQKKMAACATGGDESYAMAPFSAKASLKGEPIAEVIAEVIAQVSAEASLQETPIAEV